MKVTGIEVCFWVAFAFTIISAASLVITDSLSALGTLIVSFGVMIYCGHIAGKNQ